MKKGICSGFISLVIVMLLLSGCGLTSKPVTPASPSIPAAASVPNETLAPTVLSDESAVPQLAIDGKYLMAFHACDTTTVADCHDWKNHQVYLAQSNNGTQWNIVPGWVPYEGSVPDVIRRGETIYIYTPGQVVRYHLDTGILDNPKPVTVSGADGFVDPSVFVDDQGRLTLFFLFGRPGGDPAGCMPDQTTCENRFGSASEVEGSDGLNFTADEGDRVKVTLSSSGPIRTASDPDIFFDGTQYILYIAYGPSIAVWTSPELRGTYTASTDLPSGMLTNNTGGVAAGYFDPLTQKYWTLAHVSGQNEIMTIHCAIHDDLLQPINDSSWVAIDGESVGLTAKTNIESPGFAVNEP